MMRRIGLAVAGITALAVLGCGRHREPALTVVSSDGPRTHSLSALKAAQSSALSLDQTVFDAVLSGAERRVALPLSAGRSITLDVESVTRRGASDVTIRGRVPLQDGVAHLERISGLVSGLVDIPGQGRTILLQQPDGRIEVTQFEADIALQCAFEGQVDLGAASCPAGGLSEVRVLILYDDEVAAGRGEQALLGAIPVIVDRSNDVLAKSLVDVKLSVVATKQFSIVEQKTLKEDLDLLKMPSGIHAQAILNEKHAANADLVMFIVKSATGDDGIANQLTAPFDQFGIHAIGVMTFGSFLSKYVFVHEVGHTMGAGHQGGPGAFKSSRANVWSPQNAGTVMATGVSVLAYFSNPNVSVAGTAMGDKSHDNAGTLNATRGCVEQFRSQ